MREKGKKYIKYLHKKGFTLAELLIVVAIIAVLVAVSIPIFTGRLEKARVAATEANIRAAKAAAMADFMDQVAEIENEKNLFQVLSNLIRIKARAANTDYAEDKSSYYLYCYDASTNGLKSCVEAAGGFDAYYEANPSNSSLHTLILVEINSGGILRTRPYISAGKVEDNYGTSDSGTGDQQSNIENNTPEPPAKEYYTITVETELYNGATGTASASTDKIEVGSDGTVTLSAVVTKGNWDFWIIDGEYDLISGEEWNQTVTIRPKSNIHASASMNAGKHSG